MCTLLSPDDPTECFHPVIGLLSGNRAMSERSATRTVTIKNRRAAREAAIQAIYQADALNDWSSDAVEMFFERFYPQTQAVGDDFETESRDFSRDLITYASVNLNEIDRLISISSTNWPLPRMSRVDRSILRMSTSELCSKPEIPFRVVLNEAIEISKRFGGEESSHFVNGVLDSVVFHINELASRGAFVNAIRIAR